MFVDSVVWNALKHRRDQWHQEAIQLKEQILALERIFITDFIIVETYNFLLRKVSLAAAQDTLSLFLKSQKIMILYNNHLTLVNSQKILNKYEHLSLTDANIVWFSENTGLKTLISFDNGFNSVSSVIRIPG
ncbi:MAG: type II toxin-antitoxin system VapC family toxin [Candidatus Hodarchaeales archaeon]